MTMVHTVGASTSLLSGGGSILTECLAVGLFSLSQMDETLQALSYLRCMNSFMFHLKTSTFNGLSTPSIFSVVLATIPPPTDVSS